ncbi:hypothetical protein niasHT_028034 [Heterodera trifolii]|uniref:Uncharacterized protein n=1 Tax=Heterodera trifolii TaxID=157864 RepID=A0ABD2KEK0_9BILA
MEEIGLIGTKAKTDQSLLNQNAEIGNGSHWGEAKRWHWHFNVNRRKESALRGFSAICDCEGFAIGGRRPEKSDNAKQRDK